MNWTQIRVSGALRDRDTIAAVMCMLDPGIQIEDYSDIDMKTVYADLIDETILQADKNEIAVSIYISEEKSVPEATAFLRDRFRDLGIDCTVACVGVDEEEWSTAWRKFYKPTPIGEKLVIVPLWENYRAKPGEILIHMDPGMAFGTGTHETTRLCASLLEKYLHRGDALLDVGTGSGILGICGAKLGAGQVFACDIDPVAVRTATENAAINSVGGQMTCAVSDLLCGVADRNGGYQICTANIVADIIIRMAPQIGQLLAPSAFFISSGIIDERADDVKTALTDNGFFVLEECHDNGWCAFCCAAPDFAAGEK